MNICPVDRPWIHTYILEPYVQGCELVNQAWNGVDRSLERTPLSLRDRIVHWIQGTALMIPLLNTIIWLAWQIFGQPEKLADPFCPETNSPLSSTILETITPIYRKANEGEVEQFYFTEKTNAHSICAKWTIEKFPNQTIAVLAAEEFSSSAIYKHDGALQKLQYQQGANKEISFILVSPTQVEVTVSKKANILELPGDLPWIQQRIIGLKPFVLSDKTMLEFYAILPEYPPLVGWFLSWWIEATPFLMKCKATKIGEEDVPGFGKLLKVEVTLQKRWPYNSFKSELWFDPRTGSLKKFVDSGPFIHQKTGELDQNNL